MPVVKRFSTFVAVMGAAGALLLGGAMPAGAADPVPVLVVDGQGFGHGVGMAQDGAYWMGRSGAPAGRILGHFYPGTTMARARGNVRVVVLTDPDRDTTLTFPAGGEVRSPRDGTQAPGFPVAVAPGGAVRIRHDGRYHVTPVGAVRARQAGAAQLLPLPAPPPPSDPSTTTTTSTLLPAPPTTDPTTTTTTAAPPVPATAGAPEHVSTASVFAVPDGDGTVGVVDRGARYRGGIEAVASGGALRLVNDVDVEQYLRGMGEVRDPSWPQASLQAQAVAARTYALRAMAASGEICDTQRCQVYLGQQAEYPAMDQAVRSTAGQVLTYRGALAATVYSANGGGVSASPQEGFGTPDAVYPYLSAAPYETHSPDPWQVRVALTDLARRLGYRGRLTSVAVSRSGPSGRPVEVTLTGSAGDRPIGAIQVARALGLRSTKWQTHVALGTAPPPPPEGDRIQALPEELAQAQSVRPARLEPRANAARQAATTSPGSPFWVRALIFAAALVAAVTATALAIAARRATTPTNPA